MQIANGQQDHNLMEIHYYALADPEDLLKYGRQSNSVKFGRGFNEFYE